LLIILSRNSNHPRTPAIMRASLLILLFVLYADVSYLNAKEGGNATATMNVSVTVVEPSTMQGNNGLNVHLNGGQISRIESGCQQAGLVSIPAQPDSEMLLSIKGETALLDHGERMINFEPEARISRNVQQEQNVTVNGKNAEIRFTESDNGGYRGIAELELFGTIDAGSYKSGTFSTVYTITAEHY